MNHLKATLKKYAPGVSAWISAIRNRVYFHRSFSANQTEIRRILYGENGEVSVLTGPFKGMKYLDETVWGSIVPKWLGSYESELHDVIHSMSSRNYAVAVDVGCAEGYYATGLAFLHPRLRMVAFDTDFISRAQARRMAKINGVSNRVEIRSWCSHEALNSLLRTNSLLICDIEGFEIELLDPAKAPALLKADILVEVHEHSQRHASVEDTLRQKFRATHEITRIDATDRQTWIKEHKAFLPAALSITEREQATEEHRANGRVWLWMRLP
jgi:hypothetical protein